MEKRKQLLPAAEGLLPRALPSRVKQSGLRRAPWGVGGAADGRGLASREQSKREGDSLGGLPAGFSMARLRFVPLRQSDSELLSAVLAREPRARGCRLEILRKLRTSSLADRLAFVN